MSPTPSQSVNLQSPHKMARPSTAVQSTETTTKSYQKSDTLVDIPQDNSRNTHSNFSNTH